MTWSVSISARTKAEAKAKIQQTLESQGASNMPPVVVALLESAVDSTPGEAVSLSGSGHHDAGSGSFSLSGSFWTDAAIVQP